MTLEIQVLAFDMHKNMAGFKCLPLDKWISNDKKKTSAQIRFHQKRMFQNKDQHVHLLQ